MVDLLVGPNYRLLQQILSYIPLAVVVIDTRGSIVYCNYMAEHISGYSQGELTGMHCSLLSFDDCRSPCIFMSAVGRNHSPQIRKGSLRQKDGSRIMAIRGIYPLKDDRGKLIGALETFLNIGWTKEGAQDEPQEVSNCAFDCLQNLSLLRTYEIHLRKLIERSKSKLLGIFDEIIDGLFMIDHEYRIKAINKTQASYLDKTPRDLIEEFCYQVIANRSSICPTCKAPQVFQDGVTQTDLNIPFDNDSRCSRSDRENRHYVNIHYIPIKTELGQVHNVLVYTQNISKIKELEEGVRRAENLAGLGILASGVAHEINNPLQVILSGANCLMKKADDKGIVLEVAGQIKECADKMANIIKDLSLYSRGIQNHNVSLVSINHVIDASLSMASHVRNMKAVEIRKDYQDVDTVVGNANQFQQIFVNLIINAVDAMQNKGTIDLATYQKDGYVFIRIQDTGCGIGQESLPYIFDPFFTTKDPGKGTGLGLNVVYRIVNQYEGDIQVKSRKDEGTTFLLRFPAGIPSHEGESYNHGS
ncbi:MAG: ATP-binding protein [bacterium]